MKKPEFEYRITTAPIKKGLTWKLLGSLILSWLYDNAEWILPILLEKVFGAKKADMFLDAMGEDKPDPGTTPPAP